MRPTMRQIVARQGQAQRSDPMELPLPLGGINLVAEAGKLPPNQAASITNMIAFDGKVILRKGYSVLKSRTAPCSIVGYDLPGASGAVMVDGDGWVLKIGTDDSLTPLARSGLSSAKQLSGTVNGNYLMMVDGVNAGIKLFDGSVITAAPLTGDDAGAVWAGITSHQQRVYLWKEGSVDFWYMDQDAVQGPVYKFPLSFLGRVRGAIRAIASWSTDAGQGTNDLLAIMTTTGDIAVYEGSNPGDVLDWRLTGIYRTSKIAGADCWVNVGGDLRFATQSGVVSAAEMLSAGELAAVATHTPSRAVMPFFRDAALVANKERYWQTFIDPMGIGVWFNLPTASGSRQIVFSAQTLGAFEFDYPAMEFARGGDALWFVTADGKLCRAWTGYHDGGAVIRSSWRSDWLRPGARGARMDAVKFVMLSAGDVPLTLSVLADMREASDNTSASEQGWDSDNLDGVADEWMPIDGVGELMQFRLTIDNTRLEPIKWAKTFARTVSLSRTL